MRSSLGTALQNDHEAQEVYFQTLLPYLVDHGASTTDAIVAQPLSFFLLPLEREEVEDLLELARRKRLVRPLAESRDAYGQEIGQVEWSPTPRGWDLKRPRGLTLGALRDYVMEVTPAGQTVAKLAIAAVGALSAVPFVAPLLGVSATAKSSDGSMSAKTGAIVGAIVVVFCLAFMLYRGLSGDAKLRRGARTWQRLKNTWPQFWKWQVSALRPWLGVAGAMLVVAGPVARLLGGRHWPAIPYVMGFGIWIWLTRKNKKCDEERAPDQREPAVAPASPTEPADLPSASGVG